MIIRPWDVHKDHEKARLGVGLACEALGIECNLGLQSMWVVKVDGDDLKPFLELAKECAENPQ
jgi:hypothetical protein